MQDKKYTKGLVSCVITTHTRLSLLQRAVESVQKQTYPHTELIVVDDSSTDGTQEWAATQDFIYIRIPSEESKGGNYARNLGIKRASGEFIAFLDDDDYWYPDKTEKQVALFDNQRVGVVYGNRVNEIVGSDGTISFTEDTINKRVKGNISKLILRKIVSATSFLMIRRSVLDQVGYFDENLKFWQEYELLIRLAQSTEFDFTPDNTTCYRIDRNDSQRLTSKFEGWRQAVKYIHNKHSSLYKNLSIDERLSTKALVWGDAISRAKSAGLKLTWLKYKLLYSAWRVYDVIRNKIKGEKL